MDITGYPASMWAASLPFLGEIMRISGGYRQQSARGCLYRPPHHKRR
jgi:hypothetical protein